MIKSMLLAAGVSLAIVSTAAAVTPPAKPGATVSSDLVQVKRKWHNHGWRGNKRKHWRHNYNRRHYGHPPRGWNRYHRRPGGWKRRGCLAIGPVWYCP